jgi:hypothetical protein
VKAELLAHTDGSGSTPKLIRTLVQ